MSIAISSPLYSFVSIAETDQLPEGYYEDANCLPILTLDELKFQIIATTDNPELLQFVQIDSGVYPQWAVFDWYQINESTYVGMVHWLRTQENFEDIYDTNTCFSFSLFYQQEDEEGTTVFFQTCFKRVADAKFTSLMQYYNTCSEFGFIYGLTGPTLYNQVRLNAILAFPELPAKRKVYRKSTGEFKRLSTIMYKSWAFITDYINERMIMCLGIAVEHNVFYAQDERSDWHHLFMPEGESLRPEWNKTIPFKWRLAQVQFTMMENVSGDISLLCGNDCSDVPTYYYTDEPIGGDL
jgi:hypothetical protein